MKLGRGIDLNVVVKNGIYYYLVNSEIINTPSGKENSSGNLFVLEQDEGIILQLLISFGNLYTRQKLEIGEWTPWINLSAGCEAYSLPISSDDKLGGIKIGNGITVDNDGVASVKQYSLPTAKKDKLGGIKVGKNLNITADGTLSAIDQIYCLPEATRDRLGGIRLGTGLCVDKLGRVCVNIPISSPEKVVHQIIEKTVNVENSYNLPIASKKTLGGIKVGENLTISSDGTLSARPPERFNMPLASTLGVGGIRVDGEVFNISKEGYLQIDPSNFLPQKIEEKKEEPTKFTYVLEGETYYFSFTLKEEVEFLKKVITALMFQTGILGGDLKPFKISVKNQNNQDITLLLDSPRLLDLYVNTN